MGEDFGMSSEEKLLRRSFVTFRRLKTAEVKGDIRIPLGLSQMIEALTEDLEKALPVSPGKLGDWLMDQPDKSDFRKLLETARRHFSPRPVLEDRFRKVLQDLGI